MYQLDPMFCYCPTTSNTVVHAVAKLCYKRDYMNMLVIRYCTLFVHKPCCACRYSVLYVACLFSYAVRAPVYDQDFTITVVLHDLQVQWFTVCTWNSFSSKYAAFYTISPIAAFKVFIHVWLFLLFVFHAHMLIPWGFLRGFGFVVYHPYRHHLGFVFTLTQF